MHVRAVPSGIVALASLVFMALHIDRAHAEGAEDLYRGKTVSIVIGAGEGGFYDLNGRLIARFLRKYLPGSPVVVPQNMPGASQLRATEYAYTIAPRDGTTLLVVQPYFILNKLQNESLKFDFQKFTYIGRVGPIEMGGMVGSNSSIRDVSDAKSRDVIFGANASNGPAAMIPWAVNRLAGTRFKVVLGYQSQTAEELAIERGEIEGFGNGSFGEVRKHDRLRVLYISGPERLKKAADAPTILELVKPEDRPVMDLLASISSVGLTLIAPPGVSPDRVEILRNAFDQMLRDPEYQTGLAAIGFESDAMPGAELGQFVRSHFSPSQSLIARLLAATAPP
jgi:tripartite-type tricarboxylate transporter receptor subunit TctC